MGSVSISYSSLKNSAGEAKDVSKKYDKYADALTRNVYKKLNRYDGAWTTNLSNAKNQTSSKIETLRKEERKYEAYAEDLMDLRDECKTVDKAVRSKVSKLTATFKNANNIDDNFVEYGITYFCTTVKNDTSGGRWIGDTVDKGKSGQKYLKDSIKEWYNFEGGKELIKGVLVGVLEVALGVLAVLTAGSWLALVAGVIGIVNGIMNIWNEGEAYNTTRGGDPATGRRRSEIDTMQDYLRSSFRYGDDGEKYEYDLAAEILAGAIDVVLIADAVTSLFKDGGKILKNGASWIKNGGLGNLGKNLGKTLKSVFDPRKWDDLAKMTEGLGIDFLDNLANAFLHDGLDSVKAGLGVIKTGLKDGIGLATLEFGLHGINIFGDSKGIDFYDIKDTLVSDVIDSDLFDGSTIGGDVMEKLSGIQSIDISIPEIKVPDMTLKVA